MKKFVGFGTVALALALAQAPAVAQDAKPAAPLTEDQKNHGVETFRLLASAMQSQNVPDDVKSALMGCMYENAIGKISQTVDSVIAANPGKIDRAKPDQMLGVIAQICGYEPKAGAATAPAAKSTPPRSSNSKGR
jgi:hypothetical protein